MRFASTGLQRMSGILCRHVLELAKNCKDAEFAGRTQLCNGPISKQLRILKFSEGTNLDSNNNAKLQVIRPANIAVRSSTDILEQLVSSADCECQTRMTKLRHGTSNYSKHRRNNTFASTTYRSACAD